MSNVDWHILGPGAIGSLFAWYLADAGLQVRLLSRHPGESARIITLETLGQTETRAFHADHHNTPIQRLLVTVKAHQTAAALEAIAHRITAETLLVFLQNGMGTWDIAQTRFPTSRWLTGTTTEGAWRADDRHIVHAGRGSTWFGALQPRWQADADRLVLGLENTLFRPVVDPLILPRLWQKLVINCAINPLTVLFDCRNGELLNKPAALQQMQAICAEAEQVRAVALGIGPSPALFEQVCDVAAKTAANQSSMLQDYRRGQPTEIEFITGFLVREGKRLGIDTPQNAAVLRLIRELYS